ncbi:hypothetical protein [Rhodoferax sp. U11-2br]|uniref:hypothetical protein n=1 Tax=Rhodoferax sp. U11-2br TaxID=2838878 RepID=UPI001BE95E2A|nr:hypothetical protein [Rhodoferax sp. U11-2br]MBT3068977.1 hypothetical protein [Rhodoferax sp. U11-2br]
MEGSRIYLADGACRVPFQAGESLFFVSLASGAVAGSCARLRTHFLSFRRKKVSKERATPLSATRSKASGNLSDAGLAGNRSNSAIASDNRGSFFRQTRTTQAHTEGIHEIPLVALCATLRAHPTDGTYQRCNARRRRASSAAQGAVVRRRVAQGWADQGSRLFEAKPSSSETPHRPSNAAYRHTVPGDAFGSFFLCLLSFDEAKESECAVGRMSRPTLAAKTTKKG